MKTAISLPDDTFRRATERARDLGISRSEFFSKAAERYLDVLEAEGVTVQINEALAASGPDDDSNEVAASIGRRLVSVDGDDW